MSTTVHVSVAFADNVPRWVGREALLLWCLECISDWRLHHLHLVRSIPAWLWYNCGNLWAAVGMKVACYSHVVVHVLCQTPQLANRHKLQ